MRRIKITVSILTACAAVFAVGAVGASAALPELGRCLKVEAVKEGKKLVYHGAFKGATCQKADSNHRGRYEFYPGPGAKNHFYGLATEPEPVFETVGGSKVSCGEVVFKGEYTGAKTEKVTIGLGGCEEGASGSAKYCQSNPAKEGEIEGLQTLEGELGTIKGGIKPVVGWALKSSGPLFTFTCGKLPEVSSEQTIEGSIIGTLSKGFFGNDLNKMSLGATIKYVAKRGIQSPQAFEGATPDLLTTTKLVGLTQTKEQTGLDTTEETESGTGESHENPEVEEPLEVKTK